MQIQQTSVQKLKALLHDLNQLKDRVDAGALKQKIRDFVFSESSNHQILSHLALYLPKIPQLYFCLRIIQDLLHNNYNANKIIKDIILVNFWHGFNTKRKPDHQKSIIIKFYNQLILNDEQMIQILIDSARKSEQQCNKLLENLRWYYEKLSHQQNSQRFQYKESPYGKATQVTILCIHVIKNHQIMKVRTLENALKILIIFCLKRTQLISRLDALLPTLNSLINANRESGLALKVQVQFIKNAYPTQLQQHVADIIQNFLNYINSRIQQKADLSDELFKIKTLLPDQYQRSKRFFESCSEFIYEGIFTCQTTNLISRDKIDKLYDLAEQLINIKNQIVFRNCIKCLHRRASHMALIPQPQYNGILKDTQINRENMFNLLVENSFPFYSDDKVAQQVIQFFFKKYFPSIQWVDRAFQKIQQAIENQFQYQFDVHQFNSACFCLCRLSFYFSEQDKQKIINFLKSLLNMTESINNQNKDCVKWRIYDLITVYPFLLKDNQFLHQVVEDLMASRFPMAIHHIQKLYQKQTFNQNFGKALQNFINKKKIMVNHQTKMKYWQMILKVQKKDYDSRQPDEWYFHRNLAGKRLLKNKWQINKQYIQEKKIQMLKWPDQYYEQLKVIDLLEQQNKD